MTIPSITSVRNKGNVMIALLVADTDSSSAALEQHIRPLGFDIIRYRSPVKALDNFEEIVPEAVFIDTSDFPRHWKTLVQFIRADTGKDQTIIVLLTGERFTATDADKAVKLGVQAVIDASVPSKEEEQRLSALFARYRAIETSAESLYSGPVLSNSVFLFTNPETGMIITGKIDALSPTQLRFRPDAPSTTSNLNAGTILENCSLKTGAAVSEVSCGVTRNNFVLTLEFSRTPADFTKTISDFIGGKE